MKFSIFATYSQQIRHSTSANCFVEKKVFLLRFNIDNTENEATPAKLPHSKPYSREINEPKKEKLLKQIRNETTEK